MFSKLWHTKYLSQLIILLYVASLSIPTHAKAISDKEYIDAMKLFSENAYLAGSCKTYGSIANFLSLKSIPNGKDILIKFLSLEAKRQGHTGGPEELLEACQIYINTKKLNDRAIQESKRSIEQ
jgi:hypothetical protein